MGLKMKNINIIGVHQFLAERGRSQKNNVKEEWPKKVLLNNFQGRRVFLMEEGGGGGGDGYPDAQYDLIPVHAGT